RDGEKAVGDEIEPLQRIANRHRCDDPAPVGSTVVKAACINHSRYEDPVSWKIRLRSWPSSTSYSAVCIGSKRRRRVRGPLPWSGSSAGPRSLSHLEKCLA